VAFWLHDEDPARNRPARTAPIIASPGAAARKDWRSSLRDDLRFLKLWLRRPSHLGAILPSSKSLALAMAGQIDPAATGAVVELGGGTGSITAALLDGGTAAEDLVVIEREPALVDLLRARFAGVKVIHGDARDVVRLAQHAGVGPVKAVVSGLPLLSLPDTVCRQIIAEAFRVLRPGGCLVQFTYAPVSPISRSTTHALDIVGKRADWVLDNLPPASVWNFRRRTAPAMWPADGR
jgi:phosphatidylethanolamine/phosphatidyl-N-methylethanolamine N-methyltransferase